MRNLLFLLACVLLCGVSGAQLIIDHTCTSLGSIPTAAIEQAKANLHIAYGHTSHGSQLTDGMSGLVGQTDLMGYQGDIYAWNGGGTGGALDLRDTPFSGAEDLGNPDFTSWEAATRTYLDDHSDINVVIWSWCGQLSWASTANVDTYLSLMNGLETDYPAVRFVYMTGHHDIWSDAAIKANNQRIRDYCTANHKTLYDFYDIEAYDPDGTFYEFADDACNYYASASDETELGNWAEEWQDSHTEGTYWYTCGAAHTEPLNANLKAYAAWWLWARLGGWSGPGGEGEGEGEFAFVRVPHGGVFEEGDDLHLSVEVTGTLGAVTYQWVKDDADLADDTGVEFVRESLVLEDDGWYSCRVTDEAKSTHQTEPVHIEVLPAGSLPVAGSVAVAVTASLCLAVGWRTAGHSRRRVKRRI